MWTSGCLSQIFQQALESPEQHVGQVPHELQIVLALILGACPLCCQPVTLDRLAAAFTPT
jgi:hypothetical protein